MINERQGNPASRGRQFQSPMNTPTTRIDTKISGAWRNRMILLAFFVLAMGMWFLYDGFIEYPNRNVQYLEYQELVEEGRAHEWPGTPPDRFFRRDELIVQCVLGILLTGLGLGLAIRLVLHLRKKLWAENGVVHGPDGEEVPYAAVEGIDMRKWNSKGIAVLEYQENGEAKRLVVDDYKFTGAEDILAEIEETLESGLSRDEGSDSPNEPEGGRD